MTGRSYFNGVMGLSHVEAIEKKKKKSDTRTTSQSRTPFKPVFLRAGGLSLLSKLPGKHAFSWGQAEKEQVRWMLSNRRIPVERTTQTLCHRCNNLLCIIAKKNIRLHSRCANCFDCPCCMHTLSTRATNIPAPLPDDPTKTAMKKAYYLACGFCRWTSRDVGMADKSVGACNRSFNSTF